nr:NAC domain-containing protein 67-like [Ipomoea batatas]
MEKEEATLTMEVEKGLRDRYFKSLPPGIRFRPTDVELMDYLKKKVLKERMPLHRIKTCNIYKYHPNDLCRPDDLAREKESYFFTSRDKKYPNGARPDRKAGDGFWKATGRDMPISCKGKVVGSKKTLVYYEGKHKDVSLHKTNWIMHEYTINPNIKITPVAQGQSDNNNNSDNNILDECVLAKIYEKTTGSKKGADNCSPSQDDTQQILDSEQLPPEEQDNPILEPQEYPTAEQVAPPPQNPNHQNPTAETVGGGGYNTNMMILQGSEQLPLPPPEAQNNPILEPQQYSRPTHMGSFTGPNNEVRAQNNPILEPQQYFRATHMDSLTGPNNEVRAQNNPILEPQQYPMATRMDSLTGSRGGVRVQNNPILEPQQYPMATHMGSLIGPNNEIRAQNPILEPQQYPTANRMDSLTGPKCEVRTQNNPILKPQQYPATTHMNSLTGHNREILKEDYSTALQAAAAAAASYPNHQNPMAGAAAAAAYHRYMMIPVSEQPPLPPPEAQENPILEQVAELPPFPYQENPMDVAAAASATFYSWDAGSYGYESLQTDENFYGINSGAFSFEENNNGFWGSLNGGLEDVVNMYIGNNVNNPSANPHGSHGQANNDGDNVNPSHNPHGPANVSDK